MKTYYFKKIFLFSILLGLSQVSWAACTQTLSPGANVASAVSSAASGSTICLNSGNYGTVNFTNITRTGLVTLQSTSGIGASMSPQINNADFIKFQSMTLSGMLIQNCSTNIQVVGNTWAQDTPGIVVYDYGFNCPATNKQILIDGNTFINTRPAYSEGKLGIVSVNGVTISNNLIQGQSTNNGGDGIQTAGDIANVMIGPGNIFRDIKQLPCNSSPGVPHCDSIQYVSNCPTCTINGNWFNNVEVVLQHHDATVPVVFTNNLITNAIQMWAYSTPGSANNSRIEHNTFYNLGLAMWGTNGSGVSDTTGLIGRNNILMGSTAKPSTCSSTSCTFTYNLCQTSAQCGFNTSNTTIGTPTLVGGSPGSITTWAGWQLTSNSNGYKKGSDGQDMGTNYYGSDTASGTTPLALAPPSGLVVN
jgi:hypothetical protein